MRKLRWLAGVAAALLATACFAASGAGQVNPYWRDAYVLSFRSPDLFSDQPDEQWGQEDDRLAAGGILSDFPDWLAEHVADFDAARRDRRPILLSLHTHSGYGAGLVTYSADLQRAEVANYPWLLRTLLDAGLGDSDVSVAVDTCNAQATSFYQIRPDLQPKLVEAWSDFRQWRAKEPARAKLSAATAYPLFSRDHVAAHLGRGGKGKRENVRSAPWQPLRSEERREFHARIYGPRGVILATPTLFNLLRLGPEPRGTLTENLLTARLRGNQIDGLLSRNKAEFGRFTEFDFLRQSGPWREGPERREVAASPRERGYDDLETERDRSARPRRGPRGRSSLPRRD